MIKRTWEETIKREIQRRQRLSLHATYVVKKDKMDKKDNENKNNMNK